MDWASLPPLAALRAFAAFHDTGGVQEAGVALNVSHAAISQQLRALETHLGVTLLDRSGRAMTLTPEGRLLAEALQAGFGQMGQAVAELTGAEEDRALHISTTPGFAANMLMPRLAKFRARAPEVELVLTADSNITDPSAGGIDLAIRYGGGQWPGFEAELLIDSPIIGVASPNLVGCAPCEDPAHLSGFTWFQELGTHESTTWLERQGEHAKAGLVNLPGNLALDAARAAEGITIVSRIAVEADIAAGRLVQLFEVERGKGYWLVTRPGVQRKALRAFVTWIRREVKAL